MASMTAMNLAGPEGIIILVIVLVLFGGSQIPKLARNLGRAQKEFKDGIDEAQRSTSNVHDTTVSTPPASAPPAATTTPTATSPSDNSPHPSV